MLIIDYEVNIVPSNVVLFMQIRMFVAFIWRLSTCCCSYSYSIQLDIEGKWSCVLGTVITLMHDSLLSCEKLNDFFFSQRLFRSFTDPKMLIVLKRDLLRSTFTRPSPLVPPVLEIRLGRDGHSVDKGFNVHSP